MATKETKQSEPVIKTTDKNTQGFDSIVTNDAIEKAINTVAPQGPTPGVDVSQIVAMVVGVLQETQKASKIAFDEEQRKEAERRATEHLEKTGWAAALFVEKMKNEIAEGRYEDFRYSRNNKNIVGDDIDFNINGYHIYLKAGAITRVPKVLVPELVAFLERNRPIVPEGLGFTGPTEGLTEREKSVLDRARVPINR